MTSQQQASWETQGERAYRMLRQLVREGHHAPGTVLSENVLASELGMSRTPVREAIGRLCQEELLVRLPARGVLVNTLGADDVREIYEVREALEAMTVRTAAATMTDDELVDLRGLLGDATRRVDDGISGLAYRALDRTFHEALWRAGRNRHAYALLDQSHDAAVIDPWFRSISEFPGQTRRSVAEHAAIVEALEARDADAAERAVRAHVQSYQRTLAAYLFGRAASEGAG